MQYIVIDSIIQIGLRFSLAHHRTDFGLVYGWSEIFPFWESRGSNFSQSALDNFLEKTISGRTQSMNKLFVNRLARLENVQATPEICNRHHRRCRSKNSAMWRNFRLNAKIVPFSGENCLFSCPGFSGDHCLFWCKIVNFGAKYRVSQKNVP